MGDGLGSYDLAGKIAFRRWAAKRIATGNAALRAAGPVVYLLGPVPRDWKRFAERGIGRDRLIGISRKQEHVDAAKSVGLHAICGELSDFLLAWRAPLGGLSADLTTVVGSPEYGFTVDAIAAVAKWGVFPTVINVQRGRDKATADVMREARGYELLTERQRALRERLWGPERGRSLAIHVSYLTAVYGAPTRADIIAHMRLDELCGQAPQRVFSYKSEHCYMDACAFVAVAHQRRSPTLPEPNRKMVQRIGAYRAVCTREAAWRRAGRVLLTRVI